MGGTSKVVAVVVLWAAGTAAAQEHNMGSDPRPTVTVTGEGRISAAPDLAEITLGVLAEGATAGDALRNNNDSMAALQEALKQGGIAAKDIQTSNLSVQPRYSQPDPGRPQRGDFVPRIVAYTVSNNVQVKVRDLKKLGELLDKVVSAGANQMYGISFRIAEPRALLDEARKQAMADAKRKAEQLCGEAGMVLGPPIAIQESGGSAPPMPRPMMRGMAMAAEAVPVAAGEEELGVTVQVVYSMKAPE